MIALFSQEELAAPIEYGMSVYQGTLVVHNSCGPAAAFIFLDEMEPDLVDYVRSIYVNGWGNTTLVWRGTHTHQYTWGTKLSRGGHSYQIAESRALPPHAEYECVRAVIDPTATRRSPDCVHLVAVFEFVLGGLEIMVPLDYKRSASSGQMMPTYNIPPLPKGDHQPNKNMVIAAYHEYLHVAQQTDLVRKKLLAEAP